MNGDVVRRTLGGASRVAQIVTSASGEPQVLAVTAGVAGISSLAGNASTTPVTGVPGGSYIWSYQFGGTSPSLRLEALGPDGTNYQTIATVTAGGQQGVVIGENATVRLTNTTANAITNLYSSLS